MRLRQNVEMIRTQPADEDKAGKHQTFGPGGLTPVQKERIAKLVQTEKQRKTVPLDHTLVLVKHLVKMKTENLELESYIKEMKAKMQENGIAIPSKHKPENASDNMDENAAAVGEGDNDEDSDDSDYTDSDDEDKEIVPGEGMLEQIFHLQNIENANKLGLSAGPIKSKKLAVKK